MSAVVYIITRIASIVLIDCIYLFLTLFAHHLCASLKPVLPVFQQSYPVHELGFHLTAVVTAILFCFSIHLNL